METIGKQVRLPIHTAVQIAMQGIKIRLGRALVTISGVVLGIAFLMSILTGNIITRAVSKEQTFQSKLKVMTTSAQSSLGVFEGKTVAVAVIGSKIDDLALDRAFLKDLGTEKLARIQTYHLEAVGVALPGAVPVARLDDIGQGSDLLILLGDDNNCPTAFPTLTNGMKQIAVLDSNTERTFAGQRGMQRDFFFGSAANEEAKKERDAARDAQKRMLWVVVISLLVTVIGITNALLMSVTERFKEIGTMKCLGALSGFIRQLFLIESLFIGLVGSLAGIVIGIAFPILAYSFAYGLPLIIQSLDYAQLGIFSVACLVAGCVLSVLAAIYPASMAARMIPAMALRSNV